MKLKVAAVGIGIICLLGFSLLVARTFLGWILATISSILHFIMLVPLIVLPLLLIWLLIDRARRRS